MDYRVVIGINVDLFRRQKRIAPLIRIFPTRYVDDNGFFPPLQGKGKTLHSIQALTR